MTLAEMEAAGIGPSDLPPAERAAHMERQAREVAGLLRAARWCHDHRRPFADCGCRSAPAPRVAQ